MPLQLSPITDEEYRVLTKGDPKYDHLRVRDYRFWRIYLHENQTYLFRCYVWLTAEHEDLQQRPQLKLEHEEELREITEAIHRALRGLSRPDMINEFYAGNEYHLHRGHAHMHLIPRYFDAPVFDGISFPDHRFGKNFAPCELLDVPLDTIARIRDSFREALEE